MGSRRSGSQSLLLKRVQRYAQSTALFRKVEPTMLTTVVQTGKTVKGFWQAAPSQLPVAQTTVPPQPLAPLPPAINPLDSPAFAVPMPVVPAPIVTPTIQAAPETVNVPATTPESAVSEKKEDWGGEWQRLKRILHGHESRKAEETSSELVGSETAVQRAIAAAESSSGTDSQSRAITPLEDSGWPVVRRHPQRPGVPQTMSSPSLPTPEQQEEVKAKLSGMSSHQPTDSSIEVHMPRRPRPTLSSSPPVQRQESALSSPPASPSQMVQTEIGPLPADMWEILGEPVPTSSTDSGDAEIVAGSDDDEGNKQTALPQIDVGVGSVEAVQRAIAAAEAPNNAAAEKDKPTLPSSTKPVNVQRQIEESTTANLESNDIIRDRAGDSVQRAIAQAESSPKSQATASRPTTQTSLATPLTEAASTGSPVDPEAEVVQRTIVPGEAPINEPPAMSSPSVNAESATFSPRVQRQTETPHTASPTPGPGVQRAIAHVEAPASRQIGKPQTIAKSSPVTSKPEVVQRTVVPSEAPTNKPSTPLPPFVSTESVTASTDVKRQAEPTSVRSDSENEEGTVGDVEGDVQRAIAYAEAPTAQQADTSHVPTNETKVSPLTIQRQPESSLPVLPQAQPTSEVETSHDTEAEAVVQRVIAHAEAPSGSEPSATQVQEVSSGPSVPLQRQSETSHITSKDEAANLPTLMERGDEWPDEQKPTLAPQEAIQRAIAQAERPSAAEEILSGITAVTPTNDQSEMSVITSGSMPKLAAETAQPTIGAVEVPSKALPEIHTTLPVSSTPVQRQTKLDVATPVTTPLSRVTEPNQSTENLIDQSGQAAEVIQRAIAYAESSPILSDSDPQESVAVEAGVAGQQQLESPVEAFGSGASVAVPKSELSSSVDRVQRAIAAAEAPSTPDNTEISTPKAGGETADSPTTIQRKSQTSPVSASPTGVNVPSAKGNEGFTAVTSTSPEAIQRAIAYVETSHIASSPEATPSNLPQSGGGGSDVPKQEVTLLEDAPRTNIGQMGYEEEVQRAIAKAERPSTSRENSGQRLAESGQSIRRSLLQPSGGQPLSTASREIEGGEVRKSASMVAVQRAIAAAEAPSSERRSPSMPASQERRQGLVSPPSSPIAIQRAIVAAEASPQSSTSLETVSSDIWRVVERPSVYSDTSTTTSPDIMRALSEPDLLNQAVDDQSPATAVPMIQRAKTGTSPTVESSSGGAGQVSESGGTAEINIDDLAQKVYAQLKRRLAVEWERGRGKR